MGSLVELVAKAGCMVAGAGRVVEVGSSLAEAVGTELVVDTDKDQVAEQEVQPYIQVQGDHHHSPHNHCSNLLVLVDDSAAKYVEAVASLWDQSVLACSTKCPMV